ncbi:helix-turn-helix domain-containing protein [Lacticaseibacillus kribbianus]|uniref:helix-turn-helix domain-containing protein n=1 Tax=Lacticaseibacillus kribbianus TaxID=2926292 RepID=UPI001CD2B1D0|nr:helix-turn-helix transcriptional regulator [Lacticaseibacillus kribbianus]
MGFATQVRHYRQERGWSQEALAQRLFLTRQTISKWEQGDATPDLETLVALADLFDVSLDRLVRGEGGAAAAEPAHPAAVDAPGAADHPAEAENAGDTGHAADGDAGQHPAPNAPVPPQSGRTAYDWLEENSYLFMMIPMIILIWVYALFG